MTPTTIPTTDYITAVESAIRNNKLTGAEADDLRLSVTSSLKTAKPPPSNITVEERKALASLQKDENITILPADKGRCTVILNTTDYDSKLTDLLSDNKTYEKLKGDPTNKYKNKVIKSLQKLEKEGVIDKQLYYKLYPGEATPSIYGLPKIHKKDVPLRPIVSGIDSVTYNVAKHLTSILAPLVGQGEHHIENTGDFVQKIKGLKLEPDETMVSFDVTALFTSVPTNIAVKVVKERLVEDPTLADRTKLSPDQICELFEICLDTT